ncbi:MAG TPA: sugar-transfer associated ATP-grasp domain-containing protein [Caulobacteraceae bacterium]|jgi:hypothetical protein
MAAVPRKSALFGPWPTPRRESGDEGMMGAIARMAEAAGVPPTRLMGDFAQLAIGAGRVDFSDYERLRLYDEAFWAAGDRRQAVGARRGRELALLANFRHDCLALATDRLAANAYLSAHGLPTQPVLAIYRAGLAAPGANLIRTRDELRGFLEAQAGQPLVARPVEGGEGTTLFADGRDPAAEIDRLVDQVRDAGEISWLFQPVLAPHPEAPSDRGRLAPVRLIALNTDFGPVVFRAVWRIGGPDEIVATLDLGTGVARTVVPARAPARAQVAPTGLAVPGWAQLKATATEAMRLFGQFGVVGWDVAPTVDGPVIIGLDPTPDFEIHQLADRRGVLDHEFVDFLSDRRRLAADRHRAERSWR